MKIKVFFLLSALLLICPACSEDSKEELTTVAVESISIAPNKTELKCGETCQLTATISPSNATEQHITWTSSDKQIATVSEDGLITAINKGNATIIASAGGKKGECKVSVILSIETVTVAPETATLSKKGQTVQLTATVKPEGAGEATWSSSDDNVATVSEDGLVTAVSNGRATITATTGDKSASCEVEVNISIAEIEGNKATIVLDGASKEKVSEAISDASAKGVTSFILQGSYESLGMDMHYNPFRNIPADLIDLSGVSGWPQNEEGQAVLPEKSFYGYKNEYYQGIKEIVLPAEIKKIERYGFYQCKELKKVTGAGVQTIDAYAFQNCSKLETVEFPEALRLNRGCFPNTSLISVHFPKVEIIEGFAFTNCSKLVEIDFPSVITISTYTDGNASQGISGAFSDCSSLIRVNLPKATCIGDRTFSFCKALQSIELPEAVEIGLCAFAYSPALETVKLPKATTFSKDVFTDSESLHTLWLTAEGNISVQNSTFGPADSQTKHIDLTLHISKKDETWDEFWQRESWKSHFWKSISFVE